MAKLSAYRQHEVARFTRERETPADQLIEWERETYAVMDNGRILRKRDVRFRGSANPDAFAFQRAAWFHSYGWKVAHRAGTASTVEQVARVARTLASKGYTSIPFRGRYGEQSAYAL